MSGTKDMFIDAQEAICEEYRLCNLTKDEAMKKLFHMGFSVAESEDMLHAAIS